MAPSSLDEMLTEVGPSLVDALADRATDVEAEVLERLEPSGTEQGALYAALESLDAKQREAVEWIYWQNGSKIDLALRWGFSNRNPVNRRLESAFRKLRRRLETIP
jgi:DNA-directed RNA polymerase specialized sigma24 family protein